MNRREKVRWNRMEIVYQIARWRAKRSIRATDRHIRVTNRQASKMKHVIDEQRRIQQLIEEAADD